MTQRQTTSSQEQTQGEVLARCYRILLGDGYMAAVSRLYEINPEKALQMMKSDLEIVFGERPKKTREEIEKEIAEFFKESSQ